MKINICNSKYLIILIFLIAGVINSYLSVCVSYMIMMYCIIKNDNKVLWFFLIMTIFSNIYLVCLSKNFDNTSTSLLLGCREVMMYLCIIIGVKKWNKIQKDSLVWLLFFMLIIITVLIMDGESKNIIIATRQLVAPFICYYFGTQIKIEENMMTKVYEFIIKSSCIISILGYIELIALGDEWWSMLGIQQFELNKFGTFISFNDVPLNYYSWDLMFIIPEPIRRLVSIFTNPLVTSHYLFLGFLILSFHDNVMHRRTKMLVVGIAFVLTLSKGLFLMVLIYLGMFYIRKKSYGFIIGSVGFFLVFSFVSIILGINYFYTISEGSAVGNHLGGLISGFTKTGLIGNGLGTAGTNLAMMNGETDSLDYVAESFLAVLTAQLGYAGFFVFMIYWLKKIKALICQYKINGHGNSYALSIFLIGVLLEALFSESSITVSGSGIVFILIGIELNRCTRIRWE